MTAYNSNGFHENIDFLRRNMVAYPYIHWAKWPYAVPDPLQYHIVANIGGYVCGLVDPTTNVYCFKLKHVYDANIAAGGFPGWPPHARGELVTAKVDYMAIVREMCAGR